MKKEQFDKIFAEAKQELLDSTAEQIAERLKHYQTDEDGNSISLERLAMFAYIESIAVSTKLLYSVLFKVLEIEE